MKDKKQLPKDAVITVSGRRWFEKLNGNTYHSVDVYVNGDHIGREDFAYGYGSQYTQTAMQILKDNFFLPIEATEPLWWLKKGGFKVIDVVTDVARKKDL